MGEMMTVYYSSESGGLRTVRESKEFKAESPLLRADVLCDLQMWVNAKLDTARRRAFPRRRKASTTRPRV